MRHLTAAIILAACATPAPASPTSTSPPAPTRVGLRPAPSRSPRTGSVAVTAVPAIALAELAHGIQRISCDFRLHNPGEQLKIASISVEAFDREGALVARRSIDGHGISPAIAMLPTQTLAAGSDLYVFNPLDTFPDLDIATLWVSFGFRSAAGERTVTDVRVPVRPHRPATAFRVPLDGNVLVAAGHGLTDPHRRLDLLSPIAQAFGLKANGARYAIDLSRVDDSGRLFSGDGTALEQWYGYRADVFAPADATVLAVVSAIPDNKLTAKGVDYSVDVNTPNTILGNFVLLDTGHDQVLLLAHLEHDSVPVRAGDRVHAGDRIARIGFSGNIDFVHTHVQLASSSSHDPAVILAASEGLPIYFRDFVRVNGSRTERVREDGVDTGDVIRR